MSGRLSKEELLRLRSMDFTKLNGFKNASEILDAEVGKPGTLERAEFDAKAKAWYFGDILKERRKELGMTQKELADIVGRERTYINRIEKGETDLQLSSLIRIASALGLMLKLEAVTF